MDELDVEFSVHHQKPFENFIQKKVCTPHCKNENNNKKGFIGISLVPRFKKNTLKFETA